MSNHKLAVKNFGPVESGVIDNQKITVFFGPNNSGKSMMSKLIHAILSFDSPLDDVAHVPESVHRRNVPLAHTMMIEHISRNLGLSAESIVTHGKKQCSIMIENSGENVELKITPRTKMVMYLRNQTLRHYMSSSTHAVMMMPSLYIPAGRTGTVQSFYSIAQMRNRLLSEILSSFQSYGHATDDLSPSDLKRFLRSAGSFPDSMNEFYDVVLDAFAKGMPKTFQDRFNELFAGHMLTERTGLIPSMVFEDQQGVRVNLEDAGSGVVSSLPILLGIDYVKKGGSLIIEEPEAHMEPSRQYRMMDGLYRASKTKKTRLILTTHSEYIVRKLLSLVSQRKLKRHDLGLYYFERMPGNYTEVKRMDVDKTGEAEQPLFQEALDTMMDEFLK